MPSIAASGDGIEIGEAAIGVGATGSRRPLTSIKVRPAGNRATERSPCVDTIRSALPPSTRRKLPGNVRGNSATELLAATLNLLATEGEYRLRAFLVGAS